MPGEWGQPQQTGPEASPTAHGGSPEEAARRLVRELLRLRFSIRQVMNVLRNPASGKAHRFYLANGEAEILRLIASVHGGESRSHGEAGHD